MMRDLLTTASEVLGAALITAGAFLVAPSLGFVTAGALLIAGSVLSDGDNS